MKASTRTRRLLGLVLATSLATFACTDDNNPTNNAPVPETAYYAADGIGYDLNQDNTPTEASPFTLGITSSLGDEGLWIFPTPFKVGTGLIRPFLAIQKSPVETGFNSDAKPAPEDGKEDTKALPLNYVPVIVQGGTNYREIILDANETNNAAGDWRISIDQFDVWLCPDGAQNYTSFPQSPNDCELVYDFDGKTGFATDALTQGSGNTLDYQILIPNEPFNDAIVALGHNVTACPYEGVDATPCGVWVIVDTEMGGYGLDDGGFDWASDATFEEFSTVKQPYVTITKSATPAYERTYLWQIVKDVDTPTHTLFAGQSGTSNYTVTVSPNGSEDADWAVSGVVTINNPSDEAVSITAVTDVLSPGDISVTLACGVTFPYELAADGTLECSYDHDFVSDPGTTVYTNNVEVTLDGLAVATGESDPFDFTGDPTTEINKTVNVTDTWPSDPTALGTVDWDNPGSPFTYSRQFACDGDAGQHDNTATIVETGQTDDASVTVNCLDLTVTKDASTSLERTYKWTIEKSVTPASWQLFTGDQGTSQYTVTATPDGFDDAEWMVEGSIYVLNPNTLPVYIQSITDAMTGDITATVSDCEVNATPIAFPYPLAAGGTIQCTYATAVPDQSDRTNTATVSAKPTEAGTAKDFTGDADVDFTGVELTEVNKVIDIVDTYPTDPTVLGDDWDWSDGMFETTYERTFTCDADEGTHDNTATIVETQQSDDASVTVACYQLAVTKDASTTWQRSWTWTIDKVLDATHFLDGTFDVASNTATIMDGTALDVYWDLTLDATALDHDFAVTGGIVVSNVGNPIAATINDVADLITAGGIDGNADCSVTFPHVLAAGTTLNCTYEASLPDAVDRSNSATATQQNHAYDYELNASDNGTTDYSGQADILFASTPTMEVDECVAVVDVLEQGGVEIEAQNLGNRCASEGLPYTIQDVMHTFGGMGGIPVECGNNSFDNTGTFTTNDTQTQGSDTESVDIYVQCIEGCTLTQGYWKTHNVLFGGGASKKADPTWDELANGASTTFFLSGQSWYDVFWTAPQGNAYYNLAHQYMAAYLNTLAGASPTTDVGGALTAAEALFAAYTPDQIADLKGRDKKELVDLAGILADFNEGLTGPGHCTENDTPS